MQFDEETYRQLREQAFRQQRSISSLVREMVAKGLDTGRARKRPTRVNQLSSVRAGRSIDASLAPVSERHDEALAAVKR